MQLYALSVAAGFDEDEARAVHQLPRARGQTAGDL